MDKILDSEGCHYYVIEYIRRMILETFDYDVDRRWLDSEFGYECYTKFSNVVDRFIRHLCEKYDLCWYTAQKFRTCKMSILLPAVERISPLRGLLWDSLDEFDNVKESYAKYNVQPVRIA